MPIHLNALPSAPDPRDHQYQSKAIELPTMIDLRSYDSSVQDQGVLGSCVAASITNAYEVMLNILYPERFQELSRLYVYYHSRLFSDELAVDNGTEIRDGLKSVRNYGVCSEELWPYDIAKFSDQPLPKCYLDATKKTITRYEYLTRDEEVRQVLASMRPVVIGMNIYYSFLNVSPDNPTVPVPNNYDYSAGAHAVTVMGYDDTRQAFLIKNSYGPQWGDGGYAWLPYQYSDYGVFERWCFDINTPGTAL